METCSALLAFCAGNSPVVTSEFSAQRPVTRSFVVFFDLHRNKWLSKPVTWNAIVLIMTSLWWMDLMHPWRIDNVVTVIQNNTKRVHTYTPPRNVSALGPSLINPDQTRCQRFGLPSKLVVFQALWLVVHVVFGAVDCPFTPVCRLNICQIYSYIFWVS